MSYLVTTRGLPVQATRFGFNILPPNGVKLTQALHIGCAVSIDTTQPSTVHLSGDDEVIFGRIFTLEERTEGVWVGTIETQGGFTLQVDAGVTFTLGASPVGAGDGKVKIAAAVDPRFVCTEIDTAAKGYVTFVRI